MIMTILMMMMMMMMTKMKKKAKFELLSKVTLILTWVIDSPVSPESWLMSLLFVVIITMVKQGYEDYLRYSCLFHPHSE